MSQPFSSPSGGDRLNPADIVGHLLIVRPIEFEADFLTSNGPRDAIRVDVADLSVNDENGQWGAVHRDVLWFGRSLVPGLRRQIGELVLGKMTQGIGKPGQNPPWQLVDAVADPQAVQAAQQWLAIHPTFGTPVASPAPATPAVPAYQPPPGAPYQAPTPAAYQPPASPAYQPPPATVQPTLPVPAPMPAAPVTPGFVMPAGAGIPTGQAVPVPAGGSPMDALSPEQRDALRALGFDVDHPVQQTNVRLSP